MHSVKIKSTRKLAQAKVLGVPPEEFGIERTARSLRDCNYCYHEVVTKTESQLIDEGFDPEQIKGITEYTGLNEMETIERDTINEHLAITGASAPNPASRLVKITEHYIRLDYEGNGRSKLYQVITGGDQGNVLRQKDEKGKFKDCITPWDVIPFAATTPVPQPHRFFGRSVADLVMELQRQKTALKRGLLDNIYQHNNPGMEIAESHAGPNTIDDILVARPNRIVRTKQPGGLTPFVTPDISASVYPALQYLDAELETRTGLAKQTQGIDANALQNQSATAVAQVFSASQMRIKLIARVLAEGVKDIFSLLHYTIRQHGEQAETVRLRNRWVNVDPRNWKTRDDMTINVGLGSGGKAQQFAGMMAIANFQKELLMGGKANLVDDAGLYNTGSELTKILGFKNPDKFLNDPTAKDPQTGQLLHPPVPPPPDPKLQIEQMKAQNEQQATQQKGQLAMLQADNDAKHQLIKTQAEIELEKQKAELQARLALIDAKLKQEESAQKLQHEREIHAMKLTQAQVQHEQTLQAKSADSARSAQDHQQKTEQSEQQHKHTMQDKADERKARKAEEKPEEPEVIEFVHDKAGRVSQIKKGGKTLIVHRNAAGKMERLR